MVLIESRRLLLALQTLVWLTSCSVSLDFISKLWVDEAAISLCMRVCVCCSIYVLVWLEDIKVLYYCITDSMNPRSRNAGTRPLCNSWEFIKAATGISRGWLPVRTVGFNQRQWNGFCSAEDILIKGSCSLPQAIQFLGGICNSQIIPSLGWWVKHDTT